YTHGSGRGDAASNRRTYSATGRYSFAGTPAAARNQAGVRGRDNSSAKANAKATIYPYQGTASCRTPWHNVDFVSQSPGDVCAPSSVSVRGPVTARHGQW